MKNKGVTLIELLIVIVVMAIIASVTIISVSKIIENSRERVDEYNQQFLIDTLEQLFLDGTLEMNGNRVHNNETNKNYSGTGQSFYRDLDGYIANRIFPLVEEAQNSYNATGDGIYRYLFRQRNGNLQIFYYDDTKSVVVVATIDVP